MSEENNLRGRVEHVAALFRDRSDQTKRSLFARMAAKPSPAAAVAEVETLLAKKGAHGVGTGDVDAIYARHRVPRDEQMKLSLSLYEHALKTFSSYAEITDEEADYLNFLRDILNISEQALRSATTAALFPIFRAAADRFVVDGVFTDEEREQMQRLATALRVGEVAWDKAYRSAADARIKELTTAAISDERVSPEERQRIDAAGKGLRVGVGMDQQTYSLLARFEWMWQIENGALPTIIPDIALRAKEVCHASTPVIWYELRRVTQRVDYQGISYSIPIMKGFRYRIGSVAPSPVRKDVLTQIDQGQLYITNKRLIFNGALGNKSIPFASILRIQAYSDGVMVEKATGKSPTIMLGGDVETTILVIAEAFSRASQ